MSTTLVLKDNSHIDLKDIRLMWECFKKQNINFLEILFTEYYIVQDNYVDIWNELRAYNEEIAHYNNYAAVNCIAGMVYEKYKALCHPYPTLKDKIDTYGYDNKQLHHIIRCQEFLYRYIHGIPYKECLIPTDTQYLINVKSPKGYQMYSLKQAKEIADDAKCAVEKDKEAYMSTHELTINNRALNQLNTSLTNIIKKSLKEELSNI